MGQAKARGTKQQRIAKAKQRLIDRELALSIREKNLLNNMTEEELKDRGHSLTRLSLFMGIAAFGLDLDDSREKKLHELKIASINQTAEKRFEANRGQEDT